MEDLSPRPEDLEPIETASIDELQALQTERLRWSVRHAHVHVPHYRASFEAASIERSVGKMRRIVDQRPAR